MTSDLLNKSKVSVVKIFLISSVGVPNISADRIYNPVKSSPRIISHADRRWRSVMHHRCRLSEIRGIKSRRVPGRARRRLGHVTGKLSPVRREQRKGEDSDAKAIPNNLRDKPCETKPTDEKARDSRQIACNRNAATRFSCLSPSRSFSPSVYLSWRRCCSCSRWLIASCDMKINSPRCARQTIRACSSFPFFFYCAPSLERNRFRGTALRWIG